MRVSARHCNGARTRSILWNSTHLHHVASKELHGISQKDAKHSIYKDWENDS